MVRKAQKSDKELAIELLYKSFGDNPAVFWVVKKDNKFQKRLNRLAEYMFEVGLGKNGVYLSSDEKAIGICYHMNKKISLWKMLWLQIKMAFGVIGLSRVKMVLKKESYVAKKRPEDDNYLYFWYFGSTDKGKGNAMELKKHIYDYSDMQNLPIYAETTVPKNKRVYEYFGFKTYHEYNLMGGELTTWFLKREPNT